MKTAKRWFVLLLSVLIAFAAFSGCAEKTPGSAESSGTASSEAPGSSSEAPTGDNLTPWGFDKTDIWTIEVLMPPANAILEDTPVSNYIKENFGIVIKSVDYSGDMREKQNLMLAAGEYNEIQWMQRNDIVLNYINAGALVTIDEYLDKMPNFTRVFEKQIPYWRLNGSDGKLYNWETNIPRTLDSELEAHDMLVRTDALEKQGWPELLTTDDYIEFLKQAMIDFPDSIGLTMPLAESWGIQGILPILYEKSDAYSPVSNGGYTFNIKTEQFEDYFTNPYVKESFKFFNDLKQLGLFDEECFTDLLDNTIEKMSAGTPICAWYIDWVMPDINNALIEAGKEDMQYIKMPVQSTSMAEAGQKRAIRTETTRDFSAFGITKNCTNPERFLELVEWACTDEGQIMLHSGPEGLLWERDADGKRVLTDEGKKTFRDQTLMQEAGLYYTADCVLPSFATLAADGQPYDLSLEMSYIDEEACTDRQKEAYAALGWSSSNSWWAENHVLYDTGLAGAVSLDPTTDLGKLEQKMVEVRVKYSANLVMAEDDADFERIYEEAMDEYSKLDYMSVIDELNRLYAESKAQLN